MDELAVGVGFDTDMVAAPIDSLDECVEDEVASCFGEFLGEKVGEPVVAVAEAEDAGAVDGIFGSLLKGKGGDTDDVVVGSVEAFDVADGGLALVVGEGVLRDVVGESEVGLRPALEFFEGFICFFVIVAGLELAIFKGQA